MLQSPSVPHPCFCYQWTRPLQHDPGGLSPSPNCPLLCFVYTLHWLPVSQSISYRIAGLVWQCLLGSAPAYLCEALQSGICCIWLSSPPPFLCFWPTLGTSCYYCNYRQRCAFPLLAPLPEMGSPWRSAFCPRIMKI